MSPVGCEEIVNLTGIDLTDVDQSATVKLLA